jgi:DNA polymerase zeta
LDARQLGLKYIANVTYGYTAATFSGRMPAVEIADSIVQSGRETLEKVRDLIYIYIEPHINGLQAIDIIEGNRKWGAKVYELS